MKEKLFILGMVVFVFGLVFRRHIVRALKIATVGLLVLSLLGLGVVTAVEARGEGPAGTRGPLTTQGTSLAIPSPSPEWPATVPVARCWGCH